MMKHLAAGWRMMLWNPLLIVLLFLYQFGWGMILYRFVQSVVVPLMHRYPGKEISEHWNALFLAESQFQLMKTNLANSYLWILAVFLLIRMLLTPLFHAGLYYNIQRTFEDRRKSILQGVRRWGIAFSLIYWIRTALTLAPLYWLYPQLRAALLSSFSAEQLIKTALPYIVLFIIYSGLLKLISMYLQFGIVSRSGILQPLRLVFRRILPITALSIIVLTISLMVAAIGATLSIMLAGMVAILLYQAQHLLKAVFHLWTIGTQHDYWASHHTT